MYIIFNVLIYEMLKISNVSFVFWVLLWTMCNQGQMIEPEVAHRRR